MKKHNLYLFFAVVAAVLATWLAFGPHGTQHDAVAADTTPSIELLDLDGNTLSLENYKGKVVLVNFWATWCAPCREEIPHFVELTNELGGEGLVILGLSVDRGREIVDKWLKANPVNYPIAMSSNETTAEWQTLVDPEMRGGIPFSFVIDKEGTVQHVIVGYRSKTQWEAMIKPLL